MPFIYEGPDAQNPSLHRVTNPDTGASALMTEQGIQSLQASGDLARATADLPRVPRLGRVGQRTMPGGVAPPTIQDELNYEANNPQVLDSTGQDPNANMSVAPPAQPQMSVEPAAPIESDQPQVPFSLEANQAGAQLANQLLMQRTPYRGPRTVTTTTTQTPVLSPSAQVALGEAAQLRPEVDAAARHAIDTEVGVSDATQQGYEEQAKQYHDILNASRQRQADQRAMMSSYLNQMDEAVQRAQNRTVNPNRIFSSPEGPSRLGAAIAVTLGAIGSAFTGQENFAMSIINNMIDKDIEAQKADLDNANKGVANTANLLGEVRDIIGDDNTAEAVVRAAQLQEVGNRIRGLIQGATSNNIRANLELLLQQTELASAEARATATIGTQSQVQRTVQGGGGGYAVPVDRAMAIGNTAATAAGGAPTAELQNAAVRRANGGENAPSLPPVGTRATERWNRLHPTLQTRVMERNATLVEQINTIDNLRELFQENGGVTGVAWNRNAAVIAEQLVQSYLSVKSVLQGQGAQTGNELELNRRGFPNPAEITPQGLTRWLQGHPNDVPEYLNLTRNVVARQRRVYLEQMGAPVIEDRVDTISGPERNRAAESQAAPAPTVASERRAMGLDRNNRR